jgi:integron integrase
MKLLEQLRQVLRTKRYSLRTEECYVTWAEKYIRFHKGPDGFRHPGTMGAAEVEQFLSHLAVDRHVSASTQNQALNAIVFLYREVLHLELTNIDAQRAYRSRRLPVVLSRDEVRPLLDALDRQPTEEPYPLMARLMYGAGLRLMECCRLRVKDVDLERNQITVRQGKGDKDRVVMLPQAARTGLEDWLRWREALHRRDRQRGLGWVCLPDALDRKFPEAPYSLGWQFVFASRCVSDDPRSGNAAATTSTRAGCSSPSPRPCAASAGPSGPPVTRFGTALPPTCWRGTTTSAPCKSCWAMPTSAPP